jgi:hypothetical protein
MAISRRTFVKNIAVAGIALQEAAAWAVDQQPASPLPAAAHTARDVSPQKGVDLSWLAGKPPASCDGVTWGVSWPIGTFAKDQTFQLTAQDGSALPLQTWPLAIWPDGTLKWTAHATTAQATKAAQLRLIPGTSPAPEKTVSVKESPDAIDVDNGVFKCRINRTGEHLIESIDRDGKTIAANVGLICLRQDAPNLETGEALHQETFRSAIEKATVEQTGPIRAVIRIEGKHAGPDSRQWLPFSIRLYFYAGGESVRMMHSFIFDGDETKDFIRGLGVQFDVKMRDELYDRHSRFVGEDSGVWAEGVRNLSGLRRDPGREVIDSQLAGRACPPVSEFAATVSSRLNLIPAWDGYSLFQSSADAFTIKKRTGGAGVSWITAAHGGRSPGVGYIGSPSGGAAFGLRDFWQRHPTQLDVSGATTDTAQVTLWMWSPSAPPMDLRFYHDEMGMKTHEEQLEGLNITYEDYEPGFSTPNGIARTSELTIWALSHTPTREHLVELADAVSAPAVVVCPPEHYHACDLFGGMWNLPDRSAPEKARIEDQLDWYVDYYHNQVEQRRWYGFWDYGDVMHTYDADRHVWRYDVGGFAWDNSELSPDLWLWYSFLRTGSEKTFRLAEAMLRHTSEVDVYHSGPFAMLGSRHNVMHWGCSAKQLRISTPVYRRFYYYLTADERVGDLMHAMVDCDKTFLAVDPIRKIRKGPYKPEPHALSVGFGTDWGSMAVAWLAEWERTGNPHFRDKIINGMKTIAAMPHGFFTGRGAFDPDTGLFTNVSGNDVDVSHLLAVFGLVEICAELISLFKVPEFEKAWLEYCEYYNADQRQRAQALGFNAKSDGLVTAHSRLTAYAAWKKQDKTLADRAWHEFFSEDARFAPKRYSLHTDHITGPTVLRPIDEAAWVSTNDTAQWALAAMQNLAMVASALPSGARR